MKEIPKFGQVGVDIATKVTALVSTQSRKEKKFKEDTDARAREIQSNLQQLSSLLPQNKNGLMSLGNEYFTGRNSYYEYYYNPATNQITYRLTKEFYGNDDELIRVIREETHYDSSHLPRVWFKYADKISDEILQRLSG